MMTEFIGAAVFAWHDSHNYQKLEDSCDSKLCLKPTHSPADRKVYARYSSMILHALVKVNHGLYEAYVG